MENKEVKNLGEEVRKQGRGTAMTDLVYDPVSGEFKQIQHGSIPSTGEVVTGLTKDGFAA